MKSEPEVFSIQDLERQGRSRWDGVRNYQARNFMMNDMRPGDLVLFYHSNAQPPGVAGWARVSAPAVPDLTALDKKSSYFDPKATREKPIWYCVEVEFGGHFRQLVSLEQLRLQAPLREMGVLKKGNRLSIQPVTKKEYDWVFKLGQV